mmetsp:Transcript_11322/g.36168  ORF Transcript_11322/g.36168 Transcript_11322/m.36168 type:complete len:703 (-) Transcript_11322:1207-3315(-)
MEEPKRRGAPPEGVAGSTATSHAGHTVTHISGGIGRRAAAGQREGAGSGSENSNPGQQVRMASASCGEKQETSPGAAGGPRGTRATAIGDGRVSGPHAVHAASSRTSNGNQKIVADGAGSEAEVSGASPAVAEPKQGSTVPSSSSRLVASSEERALVADWFNAHVDTDESSGWGPGSTGAPATRSTWPQHQRSRADMARSFGYIPPAAPAAESLPAEAEHHFGEPSGQVGVVEGAAAAWDAPSGSWTTPVHMTGRRGAVGAPAGTVPTHQHPYSAWHQYQWQLLCQQQMQHWWSGQLMSWQQPRRPHPQLPVQEPQRSHVPCSSERGGATEPPSVSGTPRDREPERAGPRAGDPEPRNADVERGALKAERGDSVAPARSLVAEGEPRAATAPGKARLAASPAAAASATSPADTDADADAGAGAAAPSHPPKPPPPTGPAYPAWPHPAQGAHPAMFRDTWAQLVAAGGPVAGQHLFPSLPGQSSMFGWAPYSHPAAFGAALGGHPPSMHPYAYSRYGAPHGPAAAVAAAAADATRRASAVGRGSIRPGIRAGGSGGESDAMEEAMADEPPDPSPGDSSTPSATPGSVDRKMRRLFPTQVTAYLKTWLEEHVASPYPTDAEKNVMAADTGLTTKQITTWLLNARKRLLPRLRIKYGLDRNEGGAGPGASMGRNRAPRKRARAGTDDEEYTERTRSSRRSNRNVT